MKDVIERYVYDVTRRLKESQREEVKKELNANIADMLNGSERQEDIEKVLLTLGEPRNLANEYRDKPRYLISPKWMDEYLMVLKIVLIVVGAVALVFGLLNHLLNPISGNLFEVIGDVLGGTIDDMFSGLFQAFTVVTLIFVVIDHYDVKKGKNTWSLVKLPTLPKENEVKISRSGSIVGMIFTIIFGSVFIYLIANNSLYIGWYNNGIRWQATELVFNRNLIMPFIPLFILSLAIQVGSHLVKAIYGRLNVTVAVVHTLEKLVSIAVFILFVTTPNIVNPDFIQQIADYFTIEPSIITEPISSIALGFSVFLSLIVAIDIIQIWIRTLKGNKKQRTS